MKFLFSVAMLCLAVAVTAGTTTTEPCICNRAMIAVCGHDSTTDTYAWYNSDCDLKGEDCKSGIIVVDDSYCDPDTKPGIQLGIQL